MKDHPGRAALHAAAEDYGKHGLFGDGVPSRLHAAIGGDYWPLAEYIETGGQLTDVERAWLAGFLRVGRKSRRKLDQRIKEMKVVYWVQSYEDAGMTQGDAIGAVLNDPELPTSWGINCEETIKTYLKNWKNGR